MQALRAEIMHLEQTTQSQKDVHRIRALIKDLNFLWQHEELLRTLDYREVINYRNKNLFPGWNNMLPQAFSSFLFPDSN